MSVTDIPLFEGLTQDFLREAFEQGQHGRHRLRARIDVAIVNDGRAAPIQLPMTRHLLVEGRFFDAQHEPVGTFRRVVFRNQATGRLELWLGGMQVDGERRGGLAAYQRQNVDVAARHRFAMVRCTAGQQSGGYVLAKQGFAFDRVRLPGFGGDGLGVGQGGEDVVLNDTGSLARELVRAIIIAAAVDRRISNREARWLLSRNIGSSGAMLGFSANELSRRLLRSSRWPGVRQLNPT